MKKVLVPLHNGFEETEYIAVRDVLIREGLEVVSVSLTGDKTILANHNLRIGADMLYDQVKNFLDEYDALFIPGGMGVENLDKSLEFDFIVNYFTSENKKIGAICAAPRLLAKRGILKGEEATCYPDKSIIADLENNGVIYKDEPVVVSGRFVTGKQMDSSILYGYGLANFINEWK